jgi:exonuclease SbcC
MRPVRLRFSGLRSYRNEADIDFTDLDLFAIIGDTGAGKSSIIEALCLALYARKTWKGGALDEMIADGADMMRVEFTFEADGHTWTVLRARRRSGAPTDRLSSATNHVPDINQAKPVTAKIEELLGLTDEQFTRAVVMPQGRFDELLRSSNTVRNQILKSILGLDDVTAVATATVALRDKVRPIHDHYATRRSLLPADPAADLAAATTTHTALTARVAVLEATLTKVAGPAKTASDAAALRARLTAAADAVPAVAPTAAEDLQSLAADAVTLTAELAESDDREAATAAALGEVEEAITAALGGFSNRGELTAASVRLTDVAATVGTDLADASAATASAAELAASSPATVIDPTLVQKALDTARAQEEASRRHDTARDALGEAQRAWDRFVAARTDAAMAAASFADANEELATAERDARPAAEQVEAAADAVRDARDALEQARHTNLVAATAAGHGPGDDCPVCAQTLPAGFAAPTSEDLDAAERAVTAAQAAADGAVNVADQARTAVEKAKLRVEHWAGRVTDVNTAVTDAATAAVTAGVSVDATDAESAVATPAAALSAANEALETATLAATDARTGSTAAEAALAATQARHRAAVDAATKDTDRVQARLAAHVELLNGLPALWRDDETLTVDKLTDTRVTTISERFATAITRLDTLERDKQAAERHQTLAASARETLQANLTGKVLAPAKAAVAATNSYLSRIADVATALVASDGVVEVAAPSGTIDPVAEPASAADLPDTTAAVLERMAASATVHVAAWSAVKDLAAAEIAASEDVKAALAEVELATIDEVHSHLGDAKARRDSAEDQVAAAATAVAETAAVDEVLAVAAPLRENLEVLAAALGNSQFIDHLLNVREAELLAEASRRLRTITGDRFGFVADFGVKNITSGEIRSPDALSGGERFQASLALALALVEIASRGGGRLDAVFVDEGFGSLDSNALDQALATLGRVAGGGKMVALISHLRPVAEYVDTVMHVQHDDVFGSRIVTLTDDERDELLADDVRSRLTS